MNFNDYFDPIDLPFIQSRYMEYPSSLGNNITLHLQSGDIENIDQFQIALLGVPEERSSENKGCSKAPDIVRNMLLRLQKIQNVKIIDLGNFKPGKNINDTYIGLGDVLQELNAHDVCAVILGGSQDLTYSQYLSYEKQKKLFSIVTVDSQIDVSGEDEDINSGNFLNTILCNSKYLFNYTNLGHQNYLVDDAKVEMLNKLYFDAIRLGQVRSNIQEVEPILRDANILSMDISSLRQSDAPAYYNPSPNGFYCEEACQVAYYGGMSDHITSFGMYEINPSLDINNQTVNLAAQIIWHFLSGFVLRRKEDPAGQTSEFKKFIVSLTAKNDEVIFYKSIQTDRWWIEVPMFKDGVAQKILRSCSYLDYQKACNHEIPDRWWKTFQKIN